MNVNECYPSCRCSNATISMIMATVTHYSSEVTDVLSVHRKTLNEHHVLNIEQTCPKMDLSIVYR